MSCQTAILAQPAFASAVFAAPLPTDNLLLAALPEPELRRMRPSLELVSVRAGQGLSGVGVASPQVGLLYAYFPLDCIVSMIYATQDGGTAEVAVIGNEGMVGAGLFLGGSSYSSEAIARCSGFAYRIKTSLLRTYFDRSPAVRDLLMQYMQVLLVQSSQTALCNRHHTVEQQLCRWLLGAADRLRTSALAITQESIATTLGVRRAGITEAACHLQKAGLISYRRGKIELLDRAGLERHACECYRVLKKEVQRLSSARAAPGAGNCVWLKQVRAEMPEQRPGHPLPPPDGLAPHKAPKMLLVEVPPADLGSSTTAVP